MVARTGVREKQLARIVMVVAVLFAWAGNASAVFPPLYQMPPGPVIQPPVTPAAVNPPVVVAGEPAVIVDPVARTPEPSAWVGAALGLLLVAGYTWRKGRKKQSRMICG
jgi:hypothetical protein